MQYPANNESCSSKVSAQNCEAESTPFDASETLCTWIEADDDIVGIDECQHNEHTVTAQVSRQVA